MPGDPMPCRHMHCPYEPQETWTYNISYAKELARIAEALERIAAMMEAQKAPYAPWAPYPPYVAPPYIITCDNTMDGSTTDGSAPYTNTTNTAGEAVP